MIRDKNQVIGMFDLKHKQTYIFLFRYQSCYILENLLNC